MVGETYVEVSVEPGEVRASTRGLSWRRAKWVGITEQRAVWKGGGKLAAYQLQQAAI
jgi:hypothetical protein